jgi:hypothetical protein
MAHSSQVTHLLSLFEYKHLPPHLQAVSHPFWSIAHEMADHLNEGWELEVGLRKLKEAKDCFVQQAVIDQRNRGQDAPKYPSGMDWQQKISTALGVRPGELTYELDKAVQKIEAIRNGRARDGQVQDR